MECYSPKSGGPSPYLTVDLGACKSPLDINSIRHESSALWMVGSAPSSCVLPRYVDEHDPGVSCPSMRTRLAEAFEFETTSLYITSPDFRILHKRIVSFDEAQRDCYYIQWSVNDQHIPSVSKADLMHTWTPVPQDRYLTAVLVLGSACRFY